LESGAGLAWLNTSEGLVSDSLDSRWRPSALVRASVRMHLVDTRLGPWYLGAGIEERMVSSWTPRTAGFVSLEAISID
ncbi:MAG: hypothetical protein HKN93_00775, partial [Acidimicrobiia bacterium]|nr:hypothetical protein [Acidimicrobiia bacterium]